MNPLARALSLSITLALALGGCAAGPARKRWIGAPVMQPNNVTLTMSLWLKSDDLYEHSIARTNTPASGCTEVITTRGSVSYANNEIVTTPEQGTVVVSGCTDPAGNFVMRALEAARLSEQALQITSWKMDGETLVTEVAQPAAVQVRWTVETN